MQKNHKSFFLCKVACSALLATSVLIPTFARADVLVKDKQTVAFLGDSITQAGADTPVGYVRLVVSGLAANGIVVTPIFAGISGHKSNDMLARLDKDVLSKKPDWMTLSCGVNDVWHGDRGVALDQYKENITAIIDRAQAAGVKVVVLTSTMITENPAEQNNQRLTAYNDFLRQIAQVKGCPLADLNALMQTIISDDTKAAGGKAPGNFVTADGVHMNPLGNEMMALGVLRAFDLNEIQLAKADNAWLEIPRSSAVDARNMVTLKQFKQLSRIALERHLSVQDLVNELFAQAVDGAVKD
jgi:lysophospholipase L1-like esterase